MAATNNWKRPLAENSNHDGHGKDSGQEEFFEPFPPGTIKSISAENFLSMEDFTINLAPKANVIQVQNDAEREKFCILISVLLGLSPRAASSGKDKKYTSFSELPTDPCKDMVLRISFANRGKGAFQPEKFLSGEIIIRILMEPLQKTKCKPWIGDGWTEWSDSNDELSAFLKHFGVQLDRWTSLLDSTEVKRMLRRDSRTRWYEQAEKHLAKSANEAAEETRTAQIELKGFLKGYDSDGRKATLDILKRAEADARKKKETAEVYAKQVKELKQCEKKQRAASVNRHQKECDSAKEKLEKLRQEVQKLVSDYERLCEEVRDFEGKEEAASAGLEKHVKKKESENYHRITTKNRLDQVDSDLKKTEEDLQKTEEELKQIKDDIRKRKSKPRHCKAASSKQLRSLEEIQADMIKEQSNLIDSLKRRPELVKRLDGLKSEIHERDKIIEEAQLKVENIKTALKEKRKATDALAKRLSQLKDTDWKAATAEVEEAKSRWEKSVDEWNEEDSHLLKESGEDPQVHSDKVKLIEKQITQMRNEHASFDISNLEGAEASHNEAARILKRHNNGSEKAAKELMELEEKVKTLPWKMQRENLFGEIIQRFIVLRDQAKILAKATLTIDHTKKACVLAGLNPPRLALVAFYIAVGDTHKVPFSFVEGLFDINEKFPLNDLVDLCGAEACRQMMFLTSKDVDVEKKEHLLVQSLVGSGPEGFDDGRISMITSPSPSKRPRQEEAV